MIGEVREMTWTLIAEEKNDVPIRENLGRKRLERSARFAFFAEAEEWLEQQKAEGFRQDEDWDRIAKCAMAYFGPSDSPSNAWAVTVFKEIEIGQTRSAG